MSRGLEPFGFISRYFWLVCIAVAGLNYLLADFFYPADGIVGADRERRRRYRLRFLRPQDLDPWVWEFYAMDAPRMP